MKLHTIIRYSFWFNCARIVVFNSTGMHILKSNLYIFIIYLTGSTTIAALQSGRNVVSVEIDAKMFNHQVARLMSVFKDTDDDFE